MGCNYGRSSILKHKQIDTRGLTCPQPVVLVKQALEGFMHCEMTVLVDNDTARDNVVRFAKGQGCAVTVIDDGKKKL